MSSPVDVVRGLLAGQPGAAEALPPACRAHGFGAEAFGAVAVAELFARHAAPLSATPHVVETSASLALFDVSPEGATQAVVADLYDGRIGRLWRVGDVDEADACAEPSLSVAFDPFLSQARRTPPVDAREHPELAAASSAALERLMEELALGEGGPRAQVLPVRAFGGDGRAAALLAILSNTGARRREVATGLLAVSFRHDGAGALTHRLLARDAMVAPFRLHRLVPTA